MGRDLVKKVFDNDDLLEASVNSIAAILVGRTAVMISHALFNFDLNKFNSIDHFAVNVGIGVYSYKRAGGGVKGMVTAAIVAGLFNGSWEIIESQIPSYKEESIDTLVDFAVDYAGVFAYPTIDKMKGYFNKKKED